MIYLCIDRFEGDYAVCEQSGGELTDILSALLPPGAKEGDILALHSDGRLELDPEETARRRAAVLELQKKLFDS